VPLENKMEYEKINYIIRYYGHWMTEKERLAQRHLTVTMKATHGRTDSAAQAEVRNGPRRWSELLSDDPQVLQLASEGSDSFCERTAQRIFDEHSSEIVFNTCPRCGVVAKTPKARQCRFCRHDWHEPTSS
jgi:hypothetical protein